MNQPLLENLLIFPQMLRRVGIPISLEQTIDFTQALTLIDIASREQVYYATRCTLLNRHENLRLFDILFNQFWHRQGAGTAYGQKMPVAPRHDLKKAQQFTVATYMAYKARRFDQEVDVADKSETYSTIELLQQKEFSQMTPEELEAIKRLMQQMRWQVSLRKTRRYQPDRQGKSIHLRRSMREAAKHQGVPLKLWQQRKKIKQRPLVLLADISGSMEKYARLLLQFFYSVSQTITTVESFVFGTRLTRITPQLKVKNVDRAVEEATHTVVDWSGGTRIGDSLAAFNRHWSRRVLRRGAILLIISDGWERGSSEKLKNEMRYLQHRCHRLIWLNPLSGRATYQPHVEGMAAALPYIDDFLPIHNLQSLSALAEHMAALG